MLDRNRKQKSLNRRFLLILGGFACIGFLTVGLAVIFWDRFPLDLPKVQRIAFGVVVILYSGFRFWRLLRAQQDEE